MDINYTFLNDDLSEGNILHAVSSWSLTSIPQELSSSTYCMDLVCTSVCVVNYSKYASDFISPVGFIDKEIISTPLESMLDSLPSVSSLH